MVEKIKLVLSTQRTGSTYLFLHFHDTYEHVCYEPYNSGNVRAEYEPFADRAEFINRMSEPLVYLSYLSQFGLIDLKLDIVPDFVKQVIFENQDMFRVVILRRRNILAQYISHELANISNTFYSSSSVCENQIRIDCDAFYIYREKINALYTNAEKNINAYLPVTYENMDVLDIARYLRVKTCHVPEIVKLHNDYTFVLNRYELKARYPEFAL